MKRSEIRSKEGWKAFDFWAMVIAIILFILLVLLWLAGIGYADTCCQNENNADEANTPVELIQDDLEPAELSPPEPIATHAYFLSMASSGSTVLVSGTVANSGISDDILKAAANAFGQENIRSSLAIDSKAIDLDLTPVTRLLPQLATLDGMLFTLSPTQLLIAGDLPDQDALTALQQQALAVKGTDRTFKNQLEVSAEVTAAQEESAAEIDCPSVLAASSIEFAFGSADLTKQGKRELRPVLFCFAGGRYDVIGHTDSIGDDQVNQEISMSRAIAVTEYLAFLGVDPERISALGKGASEPIASNDSAEGRAKNRRIEFRPRK